MKKSTEKQNKKQVFNLIIADESGSMCIIREQAFSGLNETITPVQAMQKKYEETDQRVSLLTFDSSHMKWHYDNRSAYRVKPLRWEAYNPGGGTPLYDAIGTAISKVNAQISPDAKVLVTIITDGEENSSQEWTLKMVRNLIEKLKKNGWTFTLIGTDNLDVESMANAFAIDEHMEFHQDEKGTKAMFERERRSRVRYNACIVEETEIPTGSFFDDDEQKN